MFYRLAVLDEVWRKSTVDKDETIVNRIAFECFIFIFFSVKIQIQNIIC